MNHVKDIEWFKFQLASKFARYELEYKVFDEGDFGSLSQVEFNSKNIGGNVDFWGLGWLGIFVWDYEKEEEMLNVLLEPHQEREEASLFQKFRINLKVLFVGANSLSKTTSSKY